VKIARAAAADLELRKALGEKFALAGRSDPAKKFLPPSGARPMLRPSFHFSPFWTDPNPSGDLDGSIETINAFYGKTSGYLEPEAFHIRVRTRAPHEKTAVAPPAPAASPAPAIAALSGGKRLSVLYGTSLGTARDVAEKIAERATLGGFDTVVLATDESFVLGLEAEDGVLVNVTVTGSAARPTAPWPSKKRSTKAISPASIGRRCALPC
jgi:hypothetical protein